MDAPELPKAVRNPPKAVVIGGVVAGGILLFVWWRNRSATAAAVDTSTIDPLTGLPYSAEANTGATGGNAGEGAVGLSATVDAGGGGITDQASWTADAVSKLSGTYDPSALYAALGSYLAGSPISSDQAVIVRAAWAASGKWPFIPASYTLDTSGGSTPGTGGGGGTLPTPAAPQATTTRTSVHLSTGAIPGATLYEWQVNGADHAHTSGPSYTYPAHPGTHYNFSVSARVGTQYTPKSGNTAVTTPK